MISHRQSEEKATGPPAQGMEGTGNNGTEQSWGRGPHVSAPRPSGTPSPSSTLFCLPAPETGQGVRDTHIGSLRYRVCVLSVTPLSPRPRLLCLAGVRSLSVCLSGLSVSSSPKKEGGDTGPHEFATSTFNDVLGWRRHRKLLDRMVSTSLLRCPLPRSGQPRVLLG